MTETKLEKNGGGKSFDPDIFVYKMIAGLFPLLGLIPRKIAENLAEFLGRIWFAIDRRHRETAISNLHQAFGDRMSPVRIRKLARRSFSHLCLIVFEIGWGMRIEEKDLRSYFQFSGLEHLEAAMEKKRGVLILTGHVGNWELLMMVAGMIGLPLSAIYRPLDFRPLDMFFADLRSRHGAKLFPKSRAVFRVMRSLKENNCVGVLLDQNTGVKNGVFVDFFGKSACTHKTLAQLALRTRAPVVPCFMVRDVDMYRMECFPEIPLIDTGDAIGDVEANTRLYNQALESIIRSCPDQWFWVHQRWRTRPYKPWPMVEKKRKKRKRKRAWWKNES